MLVSRRSLIAAACGSPLALRRAHAQSAAPPPPHFGLSEVMGRARDLATAPFEAGHPLPREIAALSASRWRTIHFKSERSLFADKGPFRMELFHLGGPYTQPVTINVVRSGIATPIPYAANLFDYGKASFPKPLPIDLGFAGFRIRFPLNDVRVFDETLAFLGASYFRFLGRGQRYGLSARGLAVNAGQKDEQFPFYREFWIEAPEAGSDSLRIYALLDGQAATGAYQFDFTPKRDSSMAVQATLFSRDAKAKIGLAPLTSMFCAGEDDRRIHDDYRPERHDSDGLSIHTGSEEWIWRPLRNPVSAAVSSFLDQDTKGFGLLQRDRAFDHYEDIDRLYNLEPNYFVTPDEKWGKGRVELVELPTTDEQNDNIVASWTPDEPFASDGSRNLSYRIVASLASGDPSPNGRAIATFESPAPQSPNGPQPGAARRFLVDFAQGDLAYYQSAPDRVKAIATAVNGQILRSFVAVNPVTKGFRAGLDVSVPPGQSCELRLYLRADGRALTETWTLPWTAA